MNPAAQERSALTAGTRVPESTRLYQRADRLIAGRTHLFGRRAELHAQGISPVYSHRQQGCRLWDVDGNEYLDFNLGAGSVLLGHAFPSVVRAVQEQAARGTGLTVNHPLEIEAAEQLAEIVPCAEMVRFCKGGGESDMVAIRIARAATGRDKVAFCGYHGWHDWYLSANLAPGAALEKHLMHGITPLGVPKSLVDTTLAFEYNNLDSLRKLLEENRGEVACVIMEAARTYTPDPGYLEGVRQLTRDHGVVLIFDEVVTGFRTALGGAQEYYGVVPDMATFAKCISNGFALGAVVGKREIMQVALDSFISSVYWAEATGLAACKATLQEYRTRKVSRIIQEIGQSFMKGLSGIFQDLGLPFQVIGLPSFPAMVFEGVPGEQNAAATTLYLQETAKRGLIGGPGFMFCIQHSQADLNQALERIGEALTVVGKALEEGDPVKYLECPVKQSGFRRLV